jgi:hypothetical protein
MHCCPSVTEEAVFRSHLTLNKPKADSMLVVYPNTHLTFAIAFESLELESGPSSQAI